MVPSRAWSYGLFIVVWFYCCSTLVGAKKIITDPTEVKALEAIKKSLIDSDKNLSNWDRGDPCTSNWTGVACYSTVFEDGYHHVERLQLLGMNLSGTLSPELGKLLNLRILDFMWNNISGSIPKEIGNIKTLELLILNGNNLTGPLPEELGYLSNLDRMQIDQNKISGPLPISFSNLNKTKHFHMNNNSISGQIPQEFFNLSSILHFLLDNNNLSGHLPPEFSELKKLKILQLDNNNFGGTSIPKSYSKMSQLLKLSLKNCNLQGPIPDLSQMSNLYYIDLSSNYLNGSMPQSIVSQNITTIDLSNNSLSGTIPSYFSELHGLQRLSLANNSLSGSVASIIWQNKSLSATERLEVDLQNNNLSDVVGSFYLHQNVSIWLQGNPFCFNNNLVQFCGNISNNEDSSSGSPNASSTCLACHAPSEYNPTIPDDCFCAAPLIVGFRWKSPGFSRFLPYRSGFEKFLTEKGLNISVNQLYIEKFGWEAEHRLRMTLKIFPPYVVDDKNSHFFNNSEIQRIMNVFATMSFPSNDLFGPSDLISLSTNYNDMTQGSPSSLSKGSLVGIILGTIAASVTLSAVISLLLMRAHMIKNHAVSTRLPSSRAQMRIDGVKAFTYEEMALATNNFNNSTQIGEGGYGKVYKGILADGIVVAIKRAREGSLQGENEFFTEIELLSRLHHRNLVTLIGYCDEESEQMLVYEFMSNGNLRDNLTGRSKNPLSFDMRLRIALGSAKGILYLHTEADPPIFHRDIKASNILLDSTFTAKVADFGLSRLAPVPVEGSLPAYVSTVVKGTPGYLDPQYILSHQLTDKTDVYSLGVVFLELLTAMQPISHGKNIVREVNVAYRSGMIFSVIDGRMGSYPADSVVKFLTLALRCCQNETDARPSMAEVVRELEKILQKIPVILPESEIKIVVPVITGVEKVVTPPSSSSNPGNPYIWMDFSGSNLDSGVIPTIPPR